MLRRTTPAGELLIARPLVASDAVAAARRLLVRQVYATGVRTLPLAWVVAFGAGAAIVLQTTMAPEPPSSEFGRMLVVVVVRELAPLFSALLVAGSAGATLCAESRDGSPDWPRVLGSAIAVVCLAVHFAAVAMLGGFLVSQLLTLRTFEAVRSGLEQELAWFDLPLFVVKAGGLGAIVATIACRLPLAGRSTTALAAAMGRMFTLALLVCALYSAGITGALYAWLGAPPPP